MQQYLIMSDLSKRLKPLIEQCMLFDRFRFTKKINSLLTKPDKNKTTQLEKLILPVNERQDDICKAIEENQLIILCGETGSGKTTQLPKLCLKLGRGTFGMIGHTQPRRIAARSVAARIAEELKTELGTSNDRWHFIS